jgi:hypothetical protein
MTYLSQTTLHLGSQWRAGKVARPALQKAAHRLMVKAEGSVAGQDEPHGTD